MGDDQIQMAQEVTAWGPADPKTHPTGFTKEFTGEEEEENAFILIGRGPAFAWLPPAEHWSHACPQVPSIP